MRGSASTSTRARLRVAIACGVVLALFAAAFMVRVLDAARAGEGERALFDLGVLLVIGALVIGAAIAVVASHLTIAPVEALTGTARAMRRDLGIRSRLKGEDEVGQLGEALDELAAWVASEKQGLEDDRNRLIAILESMGEGVLVTRDGVVVLANAKLREMFLLDRAIVGRPPMEVIRAAGLDEILDRAGESDEGASGELELGGLRPRRVLVRVAPIRGKSEHAPGLVAVFNDVTELRRLESVRRDFVANVSHELRTPIHAISSAAETLQGGALSDPAAAADFVDIIRRHATRLQRLVEDLLELSRIEAREWKLSISTLDPVEVIDSAIEVVGVAASQRNAKITREGANVLVRADRTALDHVLVNLLDNAVKYGGAEPQIEVSVQREGDRVLLRVRDHGPGIAPRHRVRLFERFYRVDPGRSRAAGGTGLGLSIVKHLVEQMQGTVEVDSAVGLGTTFTVALPAAERDGHGTT
ncbi:MAG: PAS domain-containing protein [Deltaproteobacteria bacterium]|nr:PAS domain-containing protein [Deltaproteobacteria bacterium]